MPTDLNNGKDAQLPLATRVSLLEARVRLIAHVLKGFVVLLISALGWFIGWFISKQ